MSDDPFFPENLLRGAYELGRSRWPRLDLSYQVFAAYLLQRLPPAAPEIPLAQVLDKLHIADLYLACACVYNVPEAVPTLEQHCLRRLRDSFHPPSSSLDDVLQMVRVHLLLGTSTTEPKLPTYRGKSKLSSWIRVIAVRMHLHQNQKALVDERPEENVIKALAALPTPGPDAELGLIKSRFQRHFNQALRESFAALSHEQRNLLRFYYIDELTTTELGKLLGVAQPTASRRLADARAAVYEETRRRLQERLRLSSQEFESMLNVVRSQLDLSLSQLLKEEEEEPEKD
ncbi:sigma-70 family RNA polymerase sigma factor [Cystobacter fuscus]|uniref:sigma-70 family RNA polymerase sigma factor n=1 Tax=Cystobacter fuscus TaxID=43 RepID=UPI002B2E82E4|nr:sigma-70 family RNA polymerase sigma factor [Cystobacter fuscus]